MSKNNSTLGFLIKWGAISAVVVGVLSYFGIIDVNDHRIKSKVDSVERFVSGLFGEAGDTVDSAVGDAKRELNNVTNDAKRAVNGAVNDASNVVDDAKDAAKDAAHDATKGAAETVKDVKQELQ